MCWRTFCCHPWNKTRTCSVSFLVSRFFSKHEHVQGMHDIFWKGKCKWFSTKLHKWELRNWMRMQKKEETQRNACVSHKMTYSHIKMNKSHPFQYSCVLWYINASGIRTLKYIYKNAISSHKLSNSLNELIISKCDHLCKSRWFVFLRLWHNAKEERHQQRCETMPILMFY